MVDHAPASEARTRFDRTFIAVKFSVPQDNPLDTRPQRRQPIHNNERGRQSSANDFGGEIWLFTLFASFGDLSYRKACPIRVWPWNEVLSYRKAIVWTTRLTMSTPVCSLTTPIAISSPSTTRASLHFRLFGETISTCLQILRCIADRYERNSALLIEHHTTHEFEPKTFPRCY